MVIGDLVLIMTSPAQTIAKYGGVEVVSVCNSVEPGHQRVVDGTLAFLDGDADSEARTPLPDAHVVVLRVKYVAVRAPGPKVHDVAVAAKVGGAVVVAVLGGHVATAVKQDGLALSDLVRRQDDIVLEPLAEDDGGALAVEGAHLDGAYTAVVGQQVNAYQDDHPAPHGHLALNQFHQQGACQHPHKTDDGLLAGFLGIKFGQIAILGKVCAESGLGRAGRDTAEGAQNGGGDHDGDLRHQRQGGKEKIQELAAVVEDVGQKAVVLALGLDGLAHAVGEEDGGHTREGVLDDLQQQGRSG